MKTSEALLCIIKQEGGQIGTLALSAMLKKLEESGHLELDYTTEPVAKLTDKANKYLEERGLRL